MNVFDFEVIPYDTRWLVKPMNAFAKKHLTDQRVSIDTTGQWVGEALVVSHRDIGNMVWELRQAGFKVKI